MIEKWAKTFVEFQSKYGIIKKEDSNVYQYGYTLLIEVIINMVISCVLGGVLGYMKEIIFFLCMFIPLRSLCGGYHTDKAWKCIILSNLVIINAIIVSKILEDIAISLFLRGLIIITAAIFIILLTPVENKNRELDVKEKSILKGCSVVVVIIELVVWVVLIYKGMRLYCNIATLSFVIQFSSMIFCKVKLPVSDLYN